MKQLLFIVLAVFLVSSFCSAQFVKENGYLGPSIGFYFYGSSPIFGANYEYALSSVNIGTGTVGIGGLFRYWSWSIDEGTYGGETWGWTYTDIMFGVQAFYHFKMENNDKLDPFAGLTLAYDAASVKYKGPSTYSYVSPSWGGITLGASGGARYWFSPNLAGVIRVGFGSSSYSALDLGVDFKL